MLLISNPEAGILPQKALWEYPHRAHATPPSLITPNTWSEIPPPHIAAKKKNPQRSWWTLGAGPCTSTGQSRWPRRTEQVLSGFHSLRRTSAVQHAEITFMLYCIYMLFILYCIFIATGISGNYLQWNDNFLSSPQWPTASEGRGRLSTLDVSVLDEF